MDFDFGTPLSHDAFRRGLERHREALLEQRLVDEKALRTVDQELDLYDTVESMMRELTPGSTMAAALALCRILYEADAEEHAVDDDLVIEDEDKLVRGDLTVAGHLVNGGTLTVTGNLIIEGNYIERAHGYALLAVGGDLTVRNVFTEYDLVVLGDLDAAGLVYGSDDEHALDVGGTLRAQVLVQNDHPCSYRMLEVGQHFKGAIDAASAGKLFLDKALGEGGLPDRRSICTRLAAGKPVLEETGGERYSLTPRMTQLVELIRRSVTHEFTEVTGKLAIRIVLEDGSRQISFVTAEERDIIRAVVSV